MNHIVIDLEMNKIVKQIRGDSKLSSELIEIGAVKMDDHFQVIDTYQSYVSPDYGKMDKKIIELTGITDDKLVGAPGIKRLWINLQNGSAEKTQFYSWSLSDIRQFQAEAEFKEYKGEILPRMEAN